MFLASSELSAVSAALGRIPTMEEYLAHMKPIDTMAENIYRYLNFNEIESFIEAADRAKSIPLTNTAEVAWIEHYWRILKRLFLFKIDMLTLWLYKVAYQGDIFTL